MPKRDIVDRAPVVRTLGHIVFGLLYVGIAFVLIQTVGGSSYRYGNLYSSSLNQATVGFCIAAFLSVLISHLFFSLLGAILDALATISTNDHQRDIERIEEKNRE